MKRWGEQRPLHLDESELYTDLGEGNFIFVGSSCFIGTGLRKQWLIYPEHEKEFKKREKPGRRWPKK
jgi:hypothetical protein